jgi:hypothetical protein
VSPPWSLISECGNCHLSFDPFKCLCFGFQFDLHADDPHDRERFLLRTHAQVTVCVKHVLPPHLGQCVNSGSHSAAAPPLDEWGLLGGEVELP